MATSKIGDNRVIHSQGREIIYNVWTFMSDEARDSIKILFSKCWLESDGCHCHFQAITCKNYQRGKEADKGTSASFSTLGKSRPENKKVAVLDAFDVDVIRRLIHNFHVTQKQRPTLNTVLPLIRENTNFKEGKTSLRIILKKLGYRYLKTHRN
jgi:hypothetical protein